MENKKELLESFTGILESLNMKETAFIFKKEFSSKIN